MADGVAETCAHVLPSESTPDHFRLVLAHLAFCAATIRALPSALIVRFLAGGEPRFKGAVSLVSNALACCNLRISASIASTMPLMSITYSTAKVEVRPNRR
jgi:hypothetical protein